MDHGIQEPSDEDLLARMSIGEKHALDRFLLRHQERLYRFVLRSTNDPQLAADITQESFVRVWFSANRYSPDKGASGKTWLFSIARNLVRDHARRRNPFVRMSNWFGMGNDNMGSLPEIVTNHVAEPPAIAEKQEEEEALKAAIARLPDKLRMPLILCALEEMPQEEVAQILGTSRKAVELRIRRAKEMLRRQLVGTSNRQPV